MEVPTKKGFTYCQITHKHAHYGSLIRVLAPFYIARPIDFTRVVTQDESFKLFFPVGACVSRKIFEIVANESVPAEASVFPIFKCGIADPTTKKVETWWLWDGEREWRVGTLSEEQSKYPLRGIWNDTLLIQRIEEGWRSEGQFE